MMVEVPNLRQQIEAYLAQARWPQAQAALNQLWREQSTPAVASFVAARYERLRGRVAMTPCRLAFLRSFTVEPLVPLLRAAAFTSGIDLSAQVGEFNSYTQEILDPQSKLYRFEPNVVVLAAQTRDVTPKLWEAYASLSAQEIEAEVTRVVTEFRNLTEKFRANNQAHLIIHNLEVPHFRSQGILDNQLAGSQVTAIRRINQALQEIATEFPGVYLLDYDGVIASFGRARWHDEHKWLTVRLPLTADAYGYLTNEWLRYLHPLTGKVCKALVTDMDNTLWGGVIGEDGLEGIKLDGERAGVGYLALQRALLDLYQRGIILAVCSKNNPADALSALESHPNMLLRPRHFAALRINWNDKASNIRELAAELNIGLDAIAFLDDNPAERARVRGELPEVTVIELSDDPLSYAATLRNCAVFERLTLSAEDRERGRYYAEQRQRDELAGSAASLEDFYRSLSQEVEIAPVTPHTLARVAQLTQKTNQFNLTTRRYSEQQLAEMAANPQWRVYAAQVKDRFGDHGLVGVAIIRDEAANWEIDTFLLSCRVIGRTVETALLAYLAQEARAAGATQLCGWFLPTKKNAPAKEFYPAHQFQARVERDGGAWWELDLQQATLLCPEWIRLKANGVTKQ